MRDYMATLWNGPRSLCQDFRRFDSIDKREARFRISGSTQSDFGRSARLFIVIPGLDPGIPAESGGWGDPRIKSGDDEDKKSCLHQDVTPGSPTLRYPAARRGWLAK